MVWKKYFLNFIQLYNLILVEGYHAGIANYIAIVTVHCCHSIDIEFQTRVLLA